MDSSKQFLSALLAHILNVILAMELSTETDENACIWYFITFMLDSTMGVLLIFLLMKSLNMIFTYFDIRRLKSGNYFRIQEKVRVDWQIYACQLFVWNSVVIVSKFILFGLQKLFADQLKQTGTLLLSPITNPDFGSKIIQLRNLTLAIKKKSNYQQEHSMKKQQLNNLHKNQLFCEIFYNQYKLKMNPISMPQFKGDPLLFHAVAHGNVQEVISLIEDKEANVDARNINGATPLIFAVQANHPQITELLLKFKANPNLKEYYDVGEKTALHYAVEKNQFKLCQLLLDYGANPSLQDKRGLTCLHYAARQGFKQIVVLLLNYGVDINLRDENGFNASYWAQINKFNEILTLLPQPKFIPSNDLLEFKTQMREIHKIEIGKKKKKKKK
ncbi:unnamed protein product [Paramecium sonneborni]|uniref:Uncharacterized protein n=1 Tax=Paramecium sonneborni TaxID=65129 RepID=A0A8S1KAJ1_9CILI|nr:unnamed protein product [Paramecium sonneborni]